MQDSATKNNLAMDPDVVAFALRMTPGGLLNWTELVHPGFERVAFEQEPGHVASIFAKKVRWGLSPTVVFDLWLAPDRAGADDAYGKLVAFHESIKELGAARRISLGLRVGVERAVAFDGKMDGKPVTWIDFQFGYVVGKVSAMALPKEQALVEAHRVADVVVQLTADWVMKHGAFLYP